MDASKPCSGEIPNVNKITKIDKSQFPIVGIGTSAGGLEALSSFFLNMPINNGMAFVVVQHLSPTYISVLPELLQRITPIKVHKIRDNLKVKKNCIYVIPQNKRLTLQNGKLHSFDTVESGDLNLPIDIFFRSLAADRLEKSIGIILSGAGTDGSQGLKAIKQMNGLALVQTPSTAKFDGMPRSATITVVADIIAPVEELPIKLVAFLKCTTLIKSRNEMNDQSNKMLDKITILIRELSGHDFSLYKNNSVYHLIERRMAIRQIEKLIDYVCFCEENPEEVEILFHEWLICVTNF